MKEKKQSKKAEPVEVFYNQKGKKKSKKKLLEFIE